MEPNKCKKCGHPLHKNASFCANCGEPIVKEEPKQEPKQVLKQEQKQLVEVEAPEISSSAENTLSTVASVVLVGGILLSIFIFIYYIVEANELSSAYSAYGYRVSSGQEGAIILQGFLYSVAVFIATLTWWAIMKVFVNISLRLKGLQETMPLKSYYKDSTNDYEATINNTWLHVGDEVIRNKNGQKYKIKELRENGDVILDGLPNILLQPDDYTLV